jgi:hypothetical protein
MIRIVSDHGFPKGSMSDNDAFDRFKNEREYVAQSGQMKTTVAAMDWAAAEIERLQTENWQLKQACGYPIPADKETPQNPFKCGICDARARCEICDPAEVQ